MIEFTVQDSVQALEMKQLHLRYLLLDTKTGYRSQSHSLAAIMVLRQISCCQVTQVWKILIQRSRSEARPYILLLIHFILLFRPSLSPLLIEYFMAFLMGEMSRWTLFTKLTTSP